MIYLEQIQNLVQDLPEDARLPIRVQIMNDPPGVTGIAFGNVVLEEDDRGQFLVIQCDVVMDDDEWPAYDMDPEDMEAGYHANTEGEG